MYKLIKKISALCISILLIALTLLTGISAYADGEGNGSITVLDTYSDEQYLFYKLLDIEYSTVGNQTNYKYTVPSEYDAFYEDFIDGYSSSLSAKEKSRLVYEYLSTLESDSVELDEFAGRVAQYCCNSIDYITYRLQGTDNEDGTTLNNVDYGYYMMITEYADGSSGSDYGMSRVLSLTSAAPNATVTIKNDYPDITKKIVGAKNRLYDCNSACIGDEITYVLTTYVPNVANYVCYDGDPSVNGGKYGYYLFQIVDLMSKGLTFNQGSLSVTIGNDTLTENVEYMFQFESYPDNSNYGSLAGVSGFVIDFTDTENNAFNFYDLASQYEPGTAIKVTYTATLNEKAVVGTVGNPNYTKLYYSNDPRIKGQTGETPFDEVKTYTDSIQFIKSDGVSKTPITTGATFEFSSRNNDLDISGIVISTQGTASYNATTKKWTITTGSDGKVTINGLGAGTFDLEETIAPTGYTAGAKAQIIVRIPTTSLRIDDPHDINEDGDIADSLSHFASISHTVSGTPARTIDGVGFDNNGQYSFRFLNFSQSVLPETGSLTLVIAAGIGFLGIGLSMMILSKFKRRRKA